MWSIGKKHPHSWGMGGRTSAHIDGLYTQIPSQYWIASSYQVRYEAAGLFVTSVSIDGSKGRSCIISTHPHHIRWHTKVGNRNKDKSNHSAAYVKVNVKTNGNGLFHLLIKTNASCHKSFYSLLNVNVKSISLLSSDLEANERYTAGCFLAGSVAHPLARCVRRRLVGDRWYTTNMFAPHHHHMWLSHQHHHRYKYYHHR